MVSKENERLNNIQTTRTNRQDPTLAEGVPQVCGAISIVRYALAVKQSDQLKIKLSNIFSGHGRTKPE